MHRNGEWKYFRFQTHNAVENITAKVTVSDPEADQHAPLAIYLASDTLPVSAVDINGTSILQGSSIPAEESLYALLHDEIIVCGPRTVYVGITLPYWSPLTTSLPPVPFMMDIFRDVPHDDTLCETNQFRSFIFVQILQPIGVFSSLIICVTFSSLGLYDYYQCKMLQKKEQMNPLASGLDGEFEDDLDALEIGTTEDSGLLSDFLAI